VMSTRSTIRRKPWDLSADVPVAGPRCWSEERPTQLAGTRAVIKGTTMPHTTSRRRNRRPRHPAPAEPSASIDYNELEQLGKLHADGTLTDEEFAAAKAKILGT
jgi:Short C-terminal domain